MNAVELCPPPHLCCEDLGGQDLVVTITRVSFETVGEEKAQKGVIHFQEFPRGLVCNRTNLLRIVALHGNETDEWVDKQITLYPSETDFGGRTVPCIRVREQVPVETKSGARVPARKRG